LIYSTAIESRVAGHSRKRLGRAVKSGFSAPSPPAENTSARQDQARQSCTGDGGGDCRRRSRPKGIIELKAAGDLASRQIVNQFDSCGATGSKADVYRIVREEGLRVSKACERPLVSQNTIHKHIQHGGVEPCAERSLALNAEQEISVGRMGELEGGSGLVGERPTIAAIADAHRTKRVHLTVAKCSRNIGG
jgi:hypothetical protein